MVGCSGAQINLSVKSAVRLPANDCLERDIAELQSKTWKLGRKDVAGAKSGRKAYPRLPTKRNERREGGRLGTRRDHDSRKVKRPLCRSWFRLNWESSLLPCLQSALKSPHVFVSTLLKFLRQTGARALIWSSAVRDDWFVLGDTGKIFFELVYRHSDRSRQHGVRFRPSRWVASVNHREIFSGVHSPFQFFDCDSRGLSHRETSSEPQNSRCHMDDLSCRRKWRRA